MNIRYILAAVILGMTAEASYAQYTQDAFRFSQSDRGSTSRMKAIGNATTAVGGDMSSISNNPAGLGFFNKSEFSFTPEYDSSNIKGTYFGESLTDKRTRVNFNNASFVFNGKTKVPKGYSVDQGLLALNFGLSWNRTNNFYDRISYAGFNTSSSVADFFAAQGNAYGVMEGPARLAYQQYLIDDDGSNGLVPTTGSSSDQDMVQRTEGGQNEFSLALGANYSNKLYLGFGIGITNVRYDSYSSLKETGLADIYNDATNEYDRLDYLTYYDVDQSVRGSGFNFKLGVIYKPVESVRLGASFISPTWYSLSDNTSYILDTEYNKGKTSYYGDPENFDYDYNLRTPMKLSGGVAVFIGKAGFITGDVEYVDYEGMKLSNTGSDAAQNKTISELYKSTVNARVGAEGRLNENFYLRAGYGYLANPEKGIGSATNIISGGIGYRMSNFYVDATYTSVSRDQNVYPYEIGSLSPQADLSKTHSNAYLTVGFRF